MLAGSSRSGKSTLEKPLITMFVRENILNTQSKNLRPGRVLIVDTKPRWHATRTIVGSAARRYRRMAPGDTIDSVVLDSLDDWELAFDANLNPNRTVIVQRRLDNDEDSRVAIARCVRAMRRFFATQDYKEPSLLVVDEAMDFFGPNGNSATGQPIVQTSRSGGEMNLASLIAVQRTKAIAVQALTEMNVLYMFHLRFRSDRIRLVEMGLPPNTPNPPKDHSFYLLRDDKLYGKRIRLSRKG